MKDLLFASLIIGLLIGCNGQFVDRSLLEASEKDDLKKVEQLLDSGVDVEDDAKRTPLYYAAEKGYLQIAELLISHGATMNLPEGDSPLLWACYYGHIDMVKLLIENGANVNATRLADNSTPLRSAAIWGEKKEIVELLIGKGAKVNVVHRDGDTAVDRAKPEIAEILRKHGGKTGEDLRAKPWNWKEMEAVAKELLGTYEWKHGSEELGFKTDQMVLLEDSVGNTKFPEEKWKLKYLHEVHVTNSKGETDVFTIMDDKQSLLKVGRIVDNHRKGLVRQTFRKLK